RGQRLLALVDAALRHLPEPVGARHLAVGERYAATGPYQTRAVQHHDADAAAIGQGFGIDRHFRLRHRSQPFSGSNATAEIGTIWTPRRRASCTQVDTASTVTSKAEPMPTANPLARAVRSRSSSFARMAPRSRSPSMATSPAA